VRPEHVVLELGELVDRKRDGHPDRGLADEHGPASGPRRRKRLLGDGRYADRLESVVDASGDDVPDRRNRILSRRVYGVGRAESERALALRFHRVDRHNGMCGDEASAHDRRQANTAAAEHRD
jgi:hypothetical protein